MIREILIKMARDRESEILRAARESESLLGNPRYYENEKALREAAVRAAGGSSADAALYNELCRNRLKLANELGVEIAPRLKCAECKDTGYTGGGLCGCVLNAARRALSDEFGITGAYVSFEGTDFSRIPDLEHRTVLKAYHDKMKRYCASYPNKFPVILLLGATGTGKTHLAACMARAITDRGLSVMFFSAYSLNQLFIKAHLAELTERSEIIENIVSADYIVIDDLGTELAFKGFNDYLLLIISERIRLQKGILITSNLEPEQLKLRYNDRIFSRITAKDAAVLLMFPAYDLRIKRAR